MSFTSKNAPAFRETVIPEDTHIIAIMQQQFTLSNGNLLRFELNIHRLLFFTNFCFSPCILFFYRVAIVVWSIIRLNTIGKTVYAVLCVLRQYFVSAFYLVIVVDPFSQWVCHRCYHQQHFGQCNHKNRVYVWHLSTMLHGSFGFYLFILFLWSYCDDKYRSYNDASFYPLAFQSRKSVLYARNVCLKNIFLHKYAEQLAEDNNNKKLVMFGNYYHSLIETIHLNPISVEPFATVNDNFQK